MAWCLMAPSHYLNQCWWRYTMSCGIISSQWVNHTRFHSWHSLNCFVDPNWAKMAPKQTIWITHQKRQPTNSNGKGVIQIMVGDHPLFLLPNISGLPEISVHYRKMTRHMINYTKMEQTCAGSSPSSLLYGENYLLVVIQVWWELAEPNEPIII